MNQGITVVTWSGGTEQVGNLLKSMVGVKYPILLVVNACTEKISFDIPVELFDQLTIFEQPEDTFELGAIQTTLEVTNWDEFIVLQDTFEILDISIFDILFNNYPDKTVAYNPYFQMYLGKFRRKTLSKVLIPIVRDKIESIRQEERFIQGLAAIDSPEVFNNNFRDEVFYGNYEERWGRRNLVMRDQYLIKRKGVWDIRQLTG